MTDADVQEVNDSQEAEAGLEEDTGDMDSQEADDSQETDEVLEGAAGGTDPGGQDPQGSGRQGNEGAASIPLIMELRPIKKIRIPAHHRAWVLCHTPEDQKHSLAVSTDDESLQGGIHRKRGVAVRGTVNYLRKGKVHVLVENNGEASIRINPTYLLANAYALKEPDVDWARGEYSIQRVTAMLQEGHLPPDQAWPTDDELASRGKDSWWDPCRGRSEEQREQWVVEAFKLKENEYLNGEPEVCKKLVKLLSQYTDCFAGKGHVEAIPATDWVSLSLDTDPTASAVHQRPRPLSPPDQEDLDRQLAVWLKQRVIVPALPGAWGLNLVPVRKKGVAAGVRRWTVDARPLNSVTYPRPEYIGKIHSNLENLGNMNLFIQADLANSFLSIPVKPDQAHKLSFVTPRSGAFTMLRSGYGLTNSPMALEQLGTAIMRPIKPSEGTKFVDDFLLHGKDPDPLLNSFSTFLSQIRAANVKIQCSKTFLFQTRVLFLGHLVVGAIDPTKEPGLYPDPELVDCIMKTDIPQDAAELKRFLGQLAFYHSFLVNGSSVTASLHKAKARIPFNLTAEEKGDFQSAKKLLLDSTALSFPDFESANVNNFILGGDFSTTAVNTSLHQWQRGGLRLLGATGRTNKGPEQRWSSMRGEAAWLRLGLKKWNHILLRFHFYCLCDNLSLTHIKTAKDPTGFFGRLSETLTQFRITFIHRPGADSPVEDTWSRQKHHPDWSQQEKLMLTDYEDSDDEERGPAVPLKLPMGLPELMRQMGKGKKKPFEVERASFKDEEEKTPDFTASDAPMTSDDEGSEARSNDCTILAALQTEEAVTPRAARLQWARSLSSICSFLGSCDEEDEWGTEMETRANDYQGEEPRARSLSEELAATLHRLECIAPDMAAQLTAMAQGTEQPSQATRKLTPEITSQPSGEGDTWFSGNAEDYDFGDNNLAEDESRGQPLGGPGSGHFWLPGTEEEKEDRDEAYICVVRPELKIARKMPYPLTVEQKLLRQKADAVLNIVASWVGAGTKPWNRELQGFPVDFRCYRNQFELLKLVEGVLHRVPPGKGEEPLQWCVPVSSIADALDMAHVFEGRHLGRDSTAARVAKWMFWPNQFSDVGDYVLACPGCRPKDRGPRGHLTMHRPRLQIRSMQCLYIDTVGPLNMATCGARYIFVSLDGYSRYATALPTNNKEAATMAACLKVVVNQWGSYESVIADNGKEYDNHLMRATVERLGTRLYHCLPYEPRTNKVERFNRVLGSLMRSVLAEGGDYEEWPKYLPEITRAYNSSVSSVTGFTPHRLMTGRELQGPLTLWVGPPQALQSLPLAERERQKVRKDTITHLKALTNQQLYMKRQSQKYYGSMSYHPEINQKVFMYSPVAVRRQDGKGVIARKLISGWSGPWVTKKKLTDQVYEIESLGKEKTTSRIVSCDRLEPYKEGYCYDAHETSVALPEEHPFMKVTVADLYAEEINHAEEEEPAESELPAYPNQAAGGWNADTAEERADLGEKEKEHDMAQQSTNSEEPRRRKWQRRVSFQDLPVVPEEEEIVSPVTERELRAAARANRGEMEGKRTNRKERRPEGGEDKRGTSRGGAGHGGPHL